LDFRAAVAVQDSDPTKPSVNVFATPQSLVTFSGATGAALAMTTVIKSLMPAWDVTAIGVLTSFFIEGVIYLIGFDEKLGIRGNVVGLAIALINTFVIIAAVLGIQVGGITSK
jgi:hypothetical protein